MSQLAQVHALAATAARRDPKLSPQEAEKVVDQYGARAVDLMRQAFKAKFYKNPWSGKILETELTYETLRTREDFLRLVEDVKKYLGEAAR